VRSELDAAVLDESEALVHGDVANMTALEVARRTTLGIDLSRDVSTLFFFFFLIAAMPESRQGEGVIGYGT